MELTTFFLKKFKINDTLDPLSFEIDWLSLSSSFTFLPSTF